MERARAASLEAGAQQGRHTFKVKRRKEENMCLPLGCTQRGKDQGEKKKGEVLCLPLGCMQ
eukprot:1161805-Pelagomonas_calceolata.AAC.8